MESLLGLLAALLGPNGSPYRRVATRGVVGDCGGGPLLNLDVILFILGLLVSSIVRRHQALLLRLAVRIRHIVGPQELAGRDLASKLSEVTTGLRARRLWHRMEIGVGIGVIRGGLGHHVIELLQKEVLVLRASRGHQLLLLSIFGNLMSILSSSVARPLLAIRLLGQKVVLEVFRWFLVLSVQLLVG